MKNMLSKPITLIKRRNEREEDRESIINYLKNYSNVLRNKCENLNIEFDYNKSKNIFNNIINIFNNSELEYNEISEIFKGISENIFIDNVNEFNLIMNSNDALENMKNISSFIKRFELITSHFIKEHLKKFDFDIDRAYANADEYSKDEMLKIMIFAKLDEIYKDLYLNNNIFRNFFENFRKKANVYIKRIYIKQCDHNRINKIKESYDYAMDRKYVYYTKKFRLDKNAKKLS